jgi:hypothetical protein
MSFEIYSYSKSAVKRGPKIRTILAGVGFVLLLFLCIYLLISYQNYMGIDPESQAAVRLPPAKRDIRRLGKAIRTATDNELRMSGSYYFEYRGHGFQRVRLQVAEDREAGTKEYYRGLVTEVFKENLPGYNGLIAVRQGKKRICRFVVISGEISAEELRKEMRRFKKRPD